MCIRDSINPYARNNLPPVSERIINDINNRRTTRRFRSFLPSRVPPLNTDNNINRSINDSIPSNNYSPNTMNRTVISSPSIYIPNVLPFYIDNESESTNNM